MRYDPIMCMMVPDSVKTKDASWKAWSLYIDGKFVKSFNSEMPPIKEAKEYMKENHPGKVAKLSRNTGSSSGYVISSRDSKSIYKAIRMADGMFASTFGEYTKGAKFKKDKFLKELSGISNAEEFAKRMQTLDNELKNNLERLDEAYNVASKDYYAARNEIRSIMDVFSREAFSLYRKLDIK